MWKIRASSSLDMVIILPILVSPVFVFMAFDLSGLCLLPHDHHVKKSHADDGILMCCRGHSESS